MAESKYGGISSQNCCGSSFYVLAKKYFKSENVNLHQFIPFHSKRHSSSRPSSNKYKLHFIDLARHERNIFHAFKRHFAAIWHKKELLRHVVKRILNPFFKLLYSFFVPAFVFVEFQTRGRQEPFELLPRN